MKTKKTSAPKKEKASAPVKDIAPKGNPMGGLKTSSSKANKLADP